MYKLLVTLSSIAILVNGCASYLPSAKGFVNTTTGLSANNGVKNTRTGKACLKSFIGLIAYGDASIDAAKTSGGITKIATVDYDVFDILGIYGKYCTIVKGE